MEERGAPAAEKAPAAEADQDAEHEPAPIQPDQAEGEDEPGETGEAPEERQTSNETSTEENKEQ